MSALERPVGRPSPRASSKEMRPEGKIDQKKKKELRQQLGQRLESSLKVLFPTDGSADNVQRFSAYLDELPENVGNRLARRGLENWYLHWKQEGLKKEGDEDVVKCIEDLAKYEQAKRQFPYEEKRFLEELRVYEAQKIAYEQDLQEWLRKMNEREHQQRGVLRHRIMTYSTTADTVIREQLPMPSDEPFEESSRQRPGFIDTRRTQKDWNEQYPKALEDLRHSSREITEGSKTEGLLIRLGKGPKALYAYLATITALLVAMPRGEHTFAAGQSRPDESSVSDHRPHMPSQKHLSVDQDQQLIQAPLEQVGRHELHARLGNGLGREERFVVGSHQVHARVRFEVGTGYRRVDMRAGERAAVQRQVQEIVEEALRPYHARGVAPEAVNTVVDEIEVALQGSTSMEGSRAGNEALAVRRKEPVRQLMGDRFLAHGIPVQMVTYREEPGGVEGDMAETTRELMQMGVRLRPGEDWSTFINQMASSERTDGVEGARRLFGFHGVRQFNERAFDDMFERQFRSHRAVNVRVTVRHRRLVIHHPAAVVKPVPPEIRPEGKPRTVTFYNEGHNPRTPIDDPPEQTSGQSERRMRRIRTWNTEESDPDIRPEPPQKPQPPVRPTPPVLPHLPKIVSDSRRVTAKPATPGQDRRQKPKKHDWTHRTDVG